MKMKCEYCGEEGAQVGYVACQMRISIPMGLYWDSCFCNAACYENYLIDTDICDLSQDNLHDPIRFFRYHMQVVRAARRVKQSRKNPRTCYGKMSAAWGRH